jgi:hypothetical protein
MSLLTSKVDFLRGFPGGFAGFAMCWPFTIKTTVGVAATLPIGTIVTQELSGGATVVDKATTPNTSIADPKEMWVVVEGNDDFSGQFTGKCNCAKLGSGIIWVASDYASGSYTAGTPVSVSAGQIKVKASNEQIIGYVLEDRTAIDSTVVISA